MESAEFDRALAGASYAAKNEQARLRPTPAAASVAGGTSFAVSTSIQVQEADADDISTLWNLLPNLRDLPEGLLRKLSPEAVLQLNAALGKDLKTASKLSVNSRLAKNAQKVVANPVSIGAGQDNRKDVLHPARFLGGAICPATELWLTGRRLLGEKGIIPLGCYDLDAVGCGGCVTPKGWEVLHSPGSQELKIKMFYLPNVTNNGLSARRVNLEDGEEALSIGDSLKDIADLEGFRAALNAAREALHSALPWNRSISAIVGFMLNTSYLHEDLKGNSRRAAILSEFTDYIFGRNALKWENGRPFLSAEDLAHTWSQWKGKRAALFTSKPVERPGAKLSKKDTICRRFNTGTCPKQSDKECKSFFGVTLRHVCNKYMGNGKQCEKDHPRMNHK